MQAAGDTRADRARGEAIYYLHPSITPAWARLEVEPRPFGFELPYAWRLETGADYQGWLTSAIDHARLVAAIDGDSVYPDVLAAETVAAMVARTS